MITTPSALSDKYRYLDFLGEGANGKTWLARTIIGDERVAIKSLKLAHIENLKSLDLFQREAEVLSSITVHGVPKFYDAILDHDGSGECYLIQQYIDAPSIQSYLDQGRRFTETEALILMRKVAEILRQLEMNYKPSIIHRDIKPSNILCRIPENRANLQNIDPWLIDFGAVANPQKKQQGSTVAGTVGYMAPEQIVGDNTIQADYYALGATVLHMLTGIPPYKIPSELFVLQFKPILEQNAPKTSPEMTELLDILLQKDPTQRPKDIDELTRCIDNVMNHKPPKFVQIDKPTLKQSINARIGHILRSFITSQMAQTKGYITSVKIISSNIDQVIHVAEFTYSVDNDYFTNICQITENHYRNISANNDFPVECTVSYDTSNRAISRIEQTEFERISRNYIPKRQTNIPEELFAKAKIVPDPECETPDILIKYAYTFLTRFEKTDSCIAQNNNTHDYVDITYIDNMLFETLSSGNQSITSRIQTLSSPILGLPKIIDTLSEYKNNSLSSLYIVRQHIDIHPISTYLDHHIQFHEHQVLYLMQKVAHILKELHDNDASAFIGSLLPMNIHCDLNALLDCDPNATVWLTAFFITSEYHIQKHHHNHMIYGFFPPEQFIDNTTIQSDFYELGTCALYMLTNVPPYDIPTTDFRLNFEPVIQEKAPHTSKAMIVLLNHLLNPTNTRRPQSPEQLIYEIQRVMNGYIPI
ncbi:MAG: protein kinase [Proteobacteria bacterium]|nr:protein kinase [Pseudomonadota bacterium]